MEHNVGRGNFFWWSIMWDAATILWSIMWDAATFLMKHNVGGTRQLSLSQFYCCRLGIKGLPVLICLIPVSLQKKSFSKKFLTSTSTMRPKGKFGLTLFLAGKPTFLPGNPLFYPETHFFTRKPTYFTRPRFVWASLFCCYVLFKTRPGKSSSQL